MADAVERLKTGLHAIGVDAAPADLLLWWDEVRERAFEPWPRLAAPDADFAAYLAPMADPVSPAGPFSELRVDHLYLAFRSLEGEVAAIRELESMLRRVAARTFEGPTAIGVDGEDLFQTLLTRLIAGREPKLRGYRGRGSLETWLRVAARRLRIDSERRRGDKARHLDTRDALAQPSPDDDPELGYLKEHYRQHFRGAFHRALESLEPRQRNLLRYQVVEGLSSSQIAGLYRVHAATAKRWLARARADLLASTRAELQSRLGVSTQELDGVMGLVASRLELSVRRVLGSLEETG